MKTTAKLFDAIPNVRLGEDPKELPEKKTLLYRQAVAKRALVAGYREASIADQSITDLLSDLRHLCDGLGLDFAKLDRAAYGHYSEERAKARTSAANDAPLPAVKASAQTQSIKR